MSSVPILFKSKNVVLDMLSTILSKDATKLTKEDAYMSSWTLENGVFVKVVYEIESKEQAPSQGLFL